MKLTFVVIGSLIYSLIKRFVINVGLDTNFLKLISAVIVALAIGLPAMKAARTPAAKEGK